jgi:hypothetical protein
MIGTKLPVKASKITHKSPAIPAKCAYQNHFVIAGVLSLYSFYLINQVNIAYFNNVSKGCCYEN